ncbi:MAG: hypothetical protein ABIB47_01850 [Candidatus Woesearchaeota archaeon]
MKLETHLISFKEHKETIFEWALKIKGLKNSQRIIGTHTSRAIIDLLAAYLLKRNLISPGIQINHRWFKSSRVSEKLPEFDNKKEVLQKMIKLELLCEDLTYGAIKPEENIKKAILLFKELENELQNGEK